MSGGKNDGYTYEYQPATMCYNASHESDFAHMDMDQMKAMVRNAKPVEVHNVARGWTEVNNKLVGEGGDGGVRDTFLKAVAAVLEHWEGDSADRFKEQADVIAQKLQDGAKYAQYTSTAMHSAATVLETIKPEVEAMEKPSTTSSVLDAVGDFGSRSDEGLEDDLGQGASTQKALDNNSGDLSAGKEAQLKMAVKMEQLGAAYASQTKAMGTWRKTGKVEDTKDYPGDPGGTPPIPIVVMPTDSGPRLVGRTPSTGSSSSSANRSVVSPTPNGPNRVDGPGSRSTSKTAAPSTVGTDVDSITTSPGGASRGITTGTGTGSPGGGGGVGSGGTNGVAGGGTGFPGSSSGAGAGIGRRGSANGTGAATGAGRGAMGGAAMGAGAGGKGAPSASGRGPLARAKGGVVGEAKSPSRSGSGVGSGLHGSRGGTAEGRGSGGLAGGAAGNGREKKKNAKDRPDYLVEDEETWVSPNQNTTPRVIE
ncbi:hypothetical protein [Streptomyces caeruleatus]|uniref:PPE family domain-containing protein n=1 Tax=Streptomyces caeruleatus TaxID=661399 RepID=A0A124I815_9ACTN|nr:hypothetical protein [Streptomyces caeruleatus]KUN97965.1 hypothetical protein AQJ67_28735 [Streptomyces caeruleatus]